MLALLVNAGADACKAYNRGNGVVPLRLLRLEPAQYEGPGVCAGEEG